MPKYVHPLHRKHDSTRANAAQGTFRSKRTGESEATHATLSVEATFHRRTKECSTTMAIAAAYLLPN